MYAAIYGYDYQDGRRKHLGNATNLEHTTSKRVFDFGSAKVTGKCTFKIERPLLYVINDEHGRQKFSGFLKNIKQDDKSEKVEFDGEDFKKVLDTEIILDFTNDAVPDFTWSGLMAKVTEEIRQTKDPFISTLDLEFIIPTDSTDTKVIADYSKQYMVVNAKEFMKVYLSYFNYYIADYYDIVQDSLIFEFKKMSSEIISIKLKDFVHEKTTADIKVNKTIATISHNTIEDTASWENSDSAYYNAELSSNKASMIATDLPDPNGYPTGFALRKVAGHQYQSITEGEYWSSGNRTAIGIPQYGVNVCYTAPSYSSAVAAAGDPNLRTENTVIRVVYRIAATGESCPQATFIKVVPTSATYHKRSDVTFRPRPNLPEKIYTLGNDNEIYSGYAPEDKRIYPIVTKVFEATYLSEAQLNAVYELVNNRYVENIIIKQNNLVSPIDLESIELYTPVRVYDDNGFYKDIPISEKTFVWKANEKYTDVKLGFKKTLLTEIIKNEIGTQGVVKSVTSSGGGGTTVQQFEIYQGEVAPDPNQYNTWFKPIEGTEEVQMMSTTEVYTEPSTIEPDNGLDSEPTEIT